MLQNAYDQHPLLMIAVQLMMTVLVVSGTLSAIGGWMSLGKHFRHYGDFKGERWRFQNGEMRFIAGYRSCLTIGANGKGLYLSIILPFRIAHPPLFIPWPEVTVEWKDNASSWPGVKLILGRKSNVPFWINERLAINLKQAAGAAWPEIL